MKKTLSRKVENAVILHEDETNHRNAKVAVGTIAAAALLGAVGYAIATRSGRDQVSRYASRLGDLIPGRDEPQHSLRQGLHQLAENIRDLLNR